MSSILYAVIVILHFAYLKQGQVSSARLRDSLNLLQISGVSGITPPTVEVA